MAAWRFCGINRRQRLNTESRGVPEALKTFCRYQIQFTAMLDGTCAIMSTSAEHVHGFLLVGDKFKYAKLEPLSGQLALPPPNFTSNPRWFPPEAGQ